MRTILIFTVNEEKYCYKLEKLLNKLYYTYLGNQTAPKIDPRFINFFFFYTIFLTDNIYTFGTIYYLNVLFCIWPWGLLY